MITNIGMKYKLHQVLFNHQISPNQPSSGLSLQQTSNLVHSPTAPCLLENSRGSSKEHGSTNSSHLSEGGRECRQHDWKGAHDETQTDAALAFAQPAAQFLLNKTFLFYFGLN